MMYTPRQLFAIGPATALICGAVLLVYWGAVIVKGVALSRKIGKDPNFVPREKTGQWMRVLWAPTVAAWCVQPLIVGLIQPGSRAWIFSRLIKPADSSAIAPATALAVAGAAVAIAALWATFICWHRMGRSWRIGIDPGEKLELVVRGPYQLVRHPIYTLSILLMLAVLAAVPTPLMILTAIIHITMLQVEARREERYLIATHGDRYRQYQHSVGRFFPKVWAS